SRGNDDSHVSGNDLQSSTNFVNVEGSIVSNAIVEIFIGDIARIYSLAKLGKHRVFRNSYPAQLGIKAHDMHGVFAHSLIDATVWQTRQRDINVARKQHSNGIVCIDSC